jgi:receptor protein-tyrosine kinase/non-specific protein-tyrosine kinase
MLVIVVAFGGGAYLISAQQTDRYVAEAALSLPEPAETSDPVGLPIGNRLPVDQRAAINARLVSRPSVALRVKRSLRDPRPVNQLLAQITARAEARTNFLIVGASGPDPDETARLANAFAREFAAQQVRKERTQLRAVARALRVRLQRLNRSPSQTDQYTAIGLTDRISRTQALAEVARPVELVRLASVPGSPVSPKPVRNTLLGLLLGLTVAALVAFARDSLDPRLRNTRQIEDQMEARALTRVGTKALGRTPRAGKKRRLLKAPDLEAFQILRANLGTLGPDGPPRTIAVSSPMPEEGKTTVAGALGWVNAASGQRTLLIECDLRKPSLAQRLGLREAPGLVEYMAGTASSQEVIQAVDPQATGGGANGSTPTEPVLWCVTAGQLTASSGPLLRLGAFADFVGVVARSYDLVLLDTGPLLPIVDSLDVLPMADAVLLCVRAGQTTGEQLASTKAALERLGAGPVGLVVTGVGSRELETFGYGSRPAVRM